MNDRNAPYQQIAERIAPGAGAVRVRSLTGGVSAQVRAVTFADAAGEPRTIVVRQHGTAAYKDNSAEAARQQHALQQVLWDIEWPVAEPLGVDTSCALLATPYTVMDFVVGTSDVPADATPRVLTIMAERLRALHALDVSRMPQLPQRFDPRLEIFDFWMEGTEWDALRAHLKGCPDTAWDGRGSLLHGDFWPGNLLWQGENLVAILDWEDAAIGDPVSDLSVARQEILWKYDQQAVDQLTRCYYDGAIPNPRRQALWDIYCGFAAWHHMGTWGQDAATLTHMRAATLAFARAARAVLLGG